MPSSPSKISFDAINIVRAENIYLTESKKERNIKRRTTNPDEKMHEKKKPTPDTEQKSFNIKLSSRNKAQKTNSSTDIKAKNTSTANKKSKKRPINIGNLKLNAPPKNSPKIIEERQKPLHTEHFSQTSIYLTPRMEYPITNIDLENMNPNKLPSSYYESELDEFIRSQYPDFEDFSEYNLEDPLILENYDQPPVNYEPGLGNLKHFKELIDTEECAIKKRLDRREIEMLKEIVKADERYQKLKRDDYEILKEILMGQLKEISEQEQVIKIALQKIRQRRPKAVKVDNLKVENAEQPLENNKTDSKSKHCIGACIGGPTKILTGRKKVAGSQEVSVFFKNVPTLEREIKILKMLGLKLEETLKKSNGIPQQNQEMPSKPIFLTSEIIYFKHITGKASSEVHLLGTYILCGEAKEFKISHQTIEELKLERDFYIATDLQHFTLERTNFDLLRHNPDLLLRKLRPISKDSRIKFNYIEQNPLFFNHVLANICNISTNNLSELDTYIPSIKSLMPSKPKQKIIPPITMNGAAGDFVRDDTKNELLEITEKNIKPFQSIIEKKKFKPTRTPMPEKKFVSAKNCLLKTLLLGSLHLTIAFIILTAILYPDITCF